MDVNTFLKRFNLIALICFGFYLLDAGLPTIEKEGNLLDHHRPIEYSKHGRTYQSKESVIVDTSVGRIMVGTAFVGTIKVGDSIIMYKTPILGVAHRITNKRLARSTNSVNLVHSYFIFFPILVFVLGIVTVRSQSYETIQNIGSANFVITILTIYLLFKDYVR